MICVYSARYTFYDIYYPVVRNGGKDSSFSDTSVVSLQQNHNCLLVNSRDTPRFRAS